MKQMEITEKKIGENSFYIKPFPAFTAANISGDLAVLITPIVSALSALVGQGKENVMDMDVEDTLPSLATAFAGLSGDQFERLMKKLLIDHKNISVESEVTGGEVKVMSIDIANEVFCGDVQDMFVLCWEVLKINYSGFFGKISRRFGNLQQVIQSVTQNSQNTAG